jgi:signal transduction histidine kinase
MSKQSPSQEGRFSLDDQEPPETPAAGAGEAIRNARLFTAARQAKAQADAANKARSAFEQRDSATAIRDSGDSLQTIINGILDFSNIEAGRMGDYATRPIRVESLVEASMQAARRARD